ncbi:MULTISPECIES: DNA-3-methyladenine glycosylase family protein [Pseudomonas]|uniref:DNA-3-methyladenine glycosylase II n=1 Tax=Pseudomonas vlassakiae TaxID=485888 RepID=A0A923K594_9PSED|nr:MULTISPECIES: AlkA N-terminal domain-containing protein [Pseudomonas]MBH3413361.1 DNA-3-methyladenine glycosylase 2 family protein [Pseudomonas putida]MBV4543632.1 DNA-3-methyladenine glycosylase 2 family protein [Pseudomonas vlassakiae]
MPQSRLHAVQRSLTACRQHTLWLRYPTPYHWPSTQAFLAARCIPGVETFSNGLYRRSLSVAGQHAVLEARPASGNRLYIQLSGVPASAVPFLIARIRRFFDLDADPARIAAELSRDPLMARLLAVRPGLRVPQGWDACEQAMRTVLGQQISVAGAMTLAGRLVVRHGQPLRVPAAGLTHVFPTADVLAAADLENMGMPRARAATLGTLARALKEQTGLLRNGQALEPLVAELCRLKGIGPWSAQYLALRQAGASDALPLGDVALAKALRLLEGPDSRLAERAQAWRPWRAYAAQHLWASLADT